MEQVNIPQVAAAAGDNTDWSQISDMGRALLSHNCYSNSPCLIQAGLDREGVHCTMQDPVRRREDRVTRSVQNTQIVRETSFAHRYAMKVSDVSPTPDDESDPSRDLYRVALKILGLHDCDEYTFDHSQLTDDVIVQARVAMEQIFRFAEEIVIDDDCLSVFRSLNLAMNCILSINPSVIYWRHNLHDSYGFTPVHPDDHYQVDEFNEWINGIVHMKHSGLPVCATEGPTQEFENSDGSWWVMLIDIGGVPCYPYHCLQDEVRWSDARWTPVFFRDIHARNHTLAYINSAGFFIEEH